MPGNALKLLLNLKLHSLKIYPSQYIVLGTQLLQISIAGL